jgi:hypothetical protein
MVVDGITTEMVGNSDLKVYQFPGGLKLCRDGTWLQGGSPVTHGRILSYLNRNLSWSEAASRWGIPSGQWFIPVDIEDVPFFVISIELDRDEPVAILSNETEAIFRPCDLTFSEEDVPYLKVEAGGTQTKSTRARFTRSAMQTLIARVEQNGKDFVVRIGPPEAERLEPLNLAPA